MKRYFGNWSDVDDVNRDFGDYGDSPTKELVKDEEILFAAYSTPSYEGYAFVVLERDGDLYEVNGSHCSCMGLENQWDLEKTSWKALAMRDLHSYEEWDQEAVDAFKALVAEHTKGAF